MLQEVLPRASFGSSLRQIARTTMPNLRSICGKLRFHWVPL
jgi:hypothetical protein